MTAADPGEERWVRAFESWLESPFRQLWTAAVVGMAIAAFSASQLYVNWTLEGFEARFGEMLTAELVEWLLWALAVPLILLVDRRFGFERRGPVRAVAIHLLAAFVWFGLQNGVLTTLTFRVDDAATGGFADVYFRRAVLKLPASLMVYAVVVGSAWAVRAVIRQQRLRRELLEAQLRNLRSQIQPHFLFNALHTAGSLVRSEDRDGAIETLVALSDLLRRSLTHSDVDQIPLREEVEFAEAYLGIQKRRFGDRLSTRIEVPPEVEDIPVPVFLLQPIIENSIRHGLDLEDRSGSVDISVSLEGGRVVITVVDSGDGSGRGRAGLGIGLENLRRRLQRLYGPQASLRLSRRPRGGTQVTVTLPAREPRPSR